MGGQSWMGSRIQENRSINLSKEKEHLLPREELQISVGGWKKVRTTGRGRSVQTLQVLIQMAPPTLRLSCIYYLTLHQFGSVPLDFISCRYLFVYILYFLS